MDRRSWPWKKKSSDKALVGKVIAASESNGGSTQVPQDNYKKPNYVQISVESYSQLTGLEDKVKTYEEQVKTYGETVQTLGDQITELNEKLSTANSELETKENLVKQHARVAEEAVSGWEKAENEALALKSHLENITLAKLTTEDRASHLDGALKECMRQIRNLKEEHEKKLQEVFLMKTKQCEKIKNDLEHRISNFEQELLRSAAENAALIRSLQDRSDILLKISQEKTQAEAEIEHLKGNIESCEREINSLKYEVHVISKELEIRNEEKNMCMRSAEVANKQHLEDAKKIAKLEAECQRLRGLVRKKLPGPAALAQMKMEVESLGRDYGESRVRKSPVKPSSPRLSPITEFSVDNAQNFPKEKGFLTERLLAAEEETKMLKESLAKRNSELQASRSMCAKTLTKLQSLEAQLQSSSYQKGSPLSIIQTTQEGIFCQNAGNPPSLTSLSEDGNDDDRSCTDSWSTTMISEISHLQIGKSNGKPSRTGSTISLELMDDFLEMEKLACLENSSHDIPVSFRSNHDYSEASKESKEDFTEKDVLSETKCDLDLSSNQLASILDQSISHPGSKSRPVPLAEIESRISAILESLSKDADLGKNLEEVRCILQDTQKVLSKQWITQFSQDVVLSEATCDRKANPVSGVNPEMELSPSHLASETFPILTTDLEPPVCSIHDFVLYLGKEVLAIHDISPYGDGMRQKLEDFSNTFNAVIGKNAGLVQFVIDLSQVLAEACKFRLNVLTYKGTEESSSPDCIDKIALPENQLVQEDSSEVQRYQNGRTHISSPSTNPEVPDDGTVIPGSESANTSCKFVLEDLEELKLEKEKNAMELAKCTEDLETTKSQLRETEQLLTEVNSQLASAQRANSLAETQLKCMVESYRTLEARSQLLENEVNLLRVKTEALESELQEEKEARDLLLVKCKEHEEQLPRYESARAQNNLKSQQEREMESAAEKLAECQETILLLGKQLQALRPQTQAKGCTDSERIVETEIEEGFTEEKPSIGDINSQDLDLADTATSPNLQRKGAESPADLYYTLASPSAHKSPTKHQKRTPTKSHSNSSSSSSTLTPEKHSRGIGRFFSSKTKNGY